MQVRAKISIWHKALLECQAAAHHEEASLAKALKRDIAQLGICEVLQAAVHFERLHASKGTAPAALSNGYPWQRFQ